MLIDYIYYGVSDKKNYFSALSELLCKTLTFIHLHFPIKNIHENFHVLRVTPPTLDVLPSQCYRVSVGETTRLYFAKIIKIS